MSVSSVALLAGVLILGLAARQEGGEAAPAKGSAAPEVSLGAANVEKLAKMVRSYYGFRDADQSPGSIQKAKKDLDKLIDETAKVAKAAKVVEPMLALNDWREIVRRGLVVEKATVNVSWRGDLRLLTLTEEQTPFASRGDPKELQAVFDHRLKVFVSVPVDFSKVAYPVLLGLHPMDDEVRALKDMKKSKPIVDEVEKWAKTTYSKEILAKAIVVVPVMDVAMRSADGVSYTRPRWDTDEGAEWAFRALSEIVFKNLNYDARRIFLDGQNTGAMAALLYCAQYPGLQTGAIVRGRPPERINFENCIGTPILFVGKESQSLYDEWKGKEGFVLDLPVEQGDDGMKVKEALDDATLLAWMAAHPKQFAPRRILLRTDRREFASSYWFCVTEEDRAQEKLSLVADASIDRDKNQISVVVNEKVKAFDLYLNDEMLDLSKEIRVVYRRTGGASEAPEKERKEVVKRSVEDALDWAYRRPYCNTGDVYVGSVSVVLD